MRRWIATHLSVIHRAMLDMALPPLCPACSAAVGSAGLCTACFDKLRLITAPYCQSCGRPLPYLLPDGHCGRCFIDPPPLRHIRAATQYNAASRNLILPFKHAGRIQMAAPLSQIMVPELHRLVQPDHIIIPIPLHWRRLLMRRFNQSGEMAERLYQQLRRNHQTSLPYMKTDLSDFRVSYGPHMLRRKRHTKSLRGQSARMRETILRHAFQVPEKYQKDISGRPVLLIDDVMTTGATLYSAARCLQKAGSGPVDALVFARVL